MKQKLLVILKGDYMERIRQFLHKRDLGVLMIDLRRVVKERICLIRFDDEQWIRKIYKKKTGRELNLNNPERFTEKLQWYKLNYHNPLMTICADKIAVRNYLAELGYQDMLMPVFGHFRKVEEIPFESLPEKCIIKASHGSSMHLVKTEAIKKIPFVWKLIMRTWLHMNIYIEGREWPYKDVPPGIIIENYIEPKTERKLKDYKFFCFHGIPEYIQVDSDLLEDHHIDFYDRNWKKLPLRCQYPNSKMDICKPINFERMIQISADLSSPFPHVRIDFYEYDDVLKIGELTFFDGSGFYNFHPDEYDYLFAKDFTLPDPYHADTI